MIDNNVLMLFDEHFAPEKFDEWVAEELTSKLVIILFEYLEYRATLHRCELRPLYDAREKENEHFFDMLWVKQLLRQALELRHELCDALYVIFVIPVLKFLYIMIDFKLFPESGAESSQDRLVDRIDFD